MTLRGMLHPVTGCLRQSIDQNSACCRCGRRARGVSRLVLNLILRRLGGDCWTHCSYLMYGWRRTLVEVCICIRCDHIGSMLLPRGLCWVHGAVFRVILWYALLVVQAAMFLRSVILDTDMPGNLVVYWWRFWCNDTDIGLVTTYDSGVQVVDGFDLV